MKNYNCKSDDEKLEIYKHDKDVLDWINNNNDFLKAIDSYAFKTYKVQDNFTLKDIENVLKSFNIVSPYSTFDIYQIWYSGEPRFEKELKNKKLL
jgi:hypothetical protein